MLNNTSLKMEELKSSNASETEALHMELHRLKVTSKTLLFEKARQSAISFFHF